MNSNYYVDVKCTVWERRYFKADSHDEAKQMIADNSYDIHTCDTSETLEDMTREENNNQDVLELYYEDEYTDALLILTQ